MSTDHPVDISLNFMPAFFNKHLGVTYGDAYYFDPGHRAAVERAEGRFLHEALGQFGVGSPTPSPSTSIFIQPIDLLKITQGTPIHCPPDSTLETRGHAWERLSVADIKRLDPEAAAHHPFIDSLLAQYRELQRLYGDQAGIFGLKAGWMNLHAPFTTAHQLCGESLFYLMADDPPGARVIFDKIWAIYQAISARLAKAIGAPPLTQVYLGDCSACMISAEQYRDLVLPVNRAIAAHYAASHYHSCGPSSHHLASFATLPGIQSIELGAGTDLAQAARHLPGTRLRPLMDPLVVRNANPAEIGTLTRSIVTACAPAPATVICVWSLDRETPIDNVAAIYATVNEPAP